jgi:hypothetical protein
VISFFTKFSLSGGWQAGGGRQVDNARRCIRVDRGTEATIPGRFFWVAYARLCASPNGVQAG